MTSNPPIDLQLRIDSIQDPIRGRLTDRRGRTTEFTGWIELSSVLSAVTAGAENDTTPNPPNEEE